MPETRRNSTYQRLTVRCGGNTQYLEDVAGITVGQLRGRMREILNLGEGHRQVLVNDVLAGDDQRLTGTEEVEFIKPAGEKG